MSAPRHVLALIPARSGSKGLPGKNIRAFHGKPLLHWTIVAARESGLAERVIVSTDDPAMAEVARAGGAEIPFLRPPELARDDTPMLDVALDVLSKLEAEGFTADALLLLQPTSPLRTAADLHAAAALLGDLDAVVSVTPVKQHPQWLQQIDEAGRLHPYEAAPDVTSRQKLPPVYMLNGALYLIRTDALRRERTFRPLRTRAYIMPPERSSDIDTELDWRMAELLFPRRLPHERGLDTGRHAVTLSPPRNRFTPMKHLSLDDYLNAGNRWTNRLLGAEQFQMVRSAEKIEQEYQREKWGVLLSRELRDMEHAKAVEREILLGPEWRKAKAPISFKGEIFETDHVTCMEIYFGMIRSRFRKYRAESYCELGSGFGYNLSLFEGPTYGGEITEAGVTLARKLGQDVSHFDFYDLASYKMIRPGSVVFTIQAIEQIPDATSIIEGLRSQRDKIPYVVHLEPSFRPERRDLLGLFRNRYLEINDYNRNLVTLLQQAPDIEILELDEDAIGAPPLNSLHFVAWRFK